MRWAGSMILVGERDGVVVSSAMVGYDGHRGWVYYLAIAPNHQRAGLGQAMMVAAQEWLAAVGAPKIQLMVRSDNQAAADFYDSLGFEQQNVLTFGRFFSKHPD
jgi:ribosomal protein S18 acetylase RimI-like enzyme